MASYLLFSLFFLSLAQIGSSWIWMQPDSSSITTDSTGTKLLITTLSTGVFSSVDGGATFVQETKTGIWQGATSSSDAKLILADDGWSSQVVSYSTDLGATWQAVSIPTENVQTWAVGSPGLSGDGKVGLLVPYLQRSGGSITAEIWLTRSAPSFLTQSLVPAAANQVLSETWGGFPVSTLAGTTDGSVWLFVACITTYKLTVNLAANSYTISKSTTPPWTQAASQPVIAMSSTTGAVAVLAPNCAPYRLFLSTDGASTFSVVSVVSPNSGPLSGLAASADGNIIAGFGNGVFYISTNKGKDWKTSMPAQSAVNLYGGICMSSTGSMIAVAVTQGPVLITTDYGATFQQRGVPVPQPTPYPTKPPTSSPTSPTAKPTPRPSPRPTTATPTTRPSPLPTAPTYRPTTGPTKPTLSPTSGRPSTAPSPAPCVCPYSFSGSGSTAVCNTCVQAAPCCSYCPHSPQALCQTTSSQPSGSCQDAVTTTSGCGGGSSGSSGGGDGDGDGKDGTSSSSSLSLGASPSLPAYKIVLIVLSVLSAFAFVSRVCYRRYRAQQDQSQGQQGVVYPAAVTDAIPAPVLATGVHVVGNPVHSPAFGDELAPGRRIAPSAPYSNF